MRVETIAAPSGAPITPSRATIVEGPRDAFVQDREELAHVLGRPPVVPTRQFADGYGRVTHLALLLSDYAEGEVRAQMLGAYRTLFTEMETDTKFTVLVESDRDREDVEALIRDNGVPNPERLRILKPGVGDLTVWARDMMVGLFTPGNPETTALLHQSMLHDWHENDARLPALLSEATPSIVLDSEPRIVTDGGDVVSNRHESFVGYYSIAATEKKIGDAMQRDPALRDKIAEYYEKNFGKQIADGPLQYPFSFVPRENPQDDHHPSFTLVADADFKIADPGAGKVTPQQACEDMAVRLFEEHFGKPVQIMGKDNPDTPEIEEPATDHQDMGCTPIDDHNFLVGDPTLARTLLGKMSEDELKAVEARLSAQAGKPVHLPRGTWENRDNPNDFEQYARTLEGKGYHVDRLPHMEPSEDGLPYISYNNCLMERFEKDGQEIRRVFLPVYGIPVLDEYATEVWRSKGFEVHPMPLGALSAYWGALRCITNWLDRTPRG
ncbi:MAG: hypothetical protein FJX76_20090 [Armatimonadetes bacterium]|nr:hypothetical protein [Armatimonadota bacterium]